MSNTDEQAVLEAEYFAFYKGALVIKSDNPWGSFSFGFILLNSNENPSQSIKTLNHEYGHFLHFLRIGPGKYASKVAAPSFACATLKQFGLLKVNYYDLPWERIAEEYGDVNRGGYAS